MAHSDSKPERLIFPNGLRLILAPQPSSPTATALILVKAGSEYETKPQNGISHFLEHLMFKGTARRPEPGAISEELDGLGAEYNAFTSQEFTGYWAKAEAAKLPQVFDLVGDLYLNPIFNPAEIEKERGVVIEEINMYEDTPTRRAQELFSNLVYGDQPAGWDIAGTKDIIRGLKREEIAAYREKHYVAPGTVAVVAGGFRRAEILRMAKRMFSGLPRAAPPRKPKTVVRQAKPRIFLKAKDSDQSHVVLGVPVFDLFDPRRHILELLGEVLGGGMSSRLFRRVRDELGAAYYIRAGAELFLDHGHFAVWTGVDHSKIDAVIRAVLEEMKRLADREVEPKELQKAKDHLIGGFVMHLETSDEVASFYGGEEITRGRLLHPEEVIAKMQKVGAGELRRLAKDIFLNRHLNLAVIGPAEGEDRFRKLLRFS